MIMISKIMYPGGKQVYSFIDQSKIISHDILLSTPERRSTISRSSNKNYKSFAAYRFLNQ